MSASRMFDICFSQNQSGANDLSAEQRLSAFQRVRCFNVILCGYHNNIMLLQ